MGFAPLLRMSPTRARCCEAEDAGSGSPPAPGRGRRTEKPPAATRRRRRRHRPAPARRRARPTPRHRREPGTARRCEPPGRARRAWSGNARAADLLRAAGPGASAAPSHCASSNRAATSTRASGLPCVAATRRSTTSGAARVGRSIAAADAERPPTGRTGRPWLSCRRDRALAGRQHERDGVRTESPRGEGDRRGGLGVQPLQVVHQHQHRPLLGGGGEDRDGGGTQQERIGGRRAARPGQRRPERGRLAVRDVSHSVPDRVQQTEQPRVRQVRLGLDASSAEAGEGIGTRPRRLKQRRLAHPGLTRDEQRPAASRGRIAQQGVDARQLVLASGQDRGIGGFAGRDAGAVGASFDRRGICRRRPSCGHQQGS